MLLAMLVLLNFSFLKRVMAIMFTLKATTFLWVTNFKKKYIKKIKTIKLKIKKIKKIKNKKWIINIYLFLFNFLHFINTNKTFTNELFDIIQLVQINAVFQICFLFLNLIFFDKIIFYFYS